MDELKKQVGTSHTLLSTTGAVAESAPAPSLPPPPPARANNSNAYWLYFACKDAVVNMQSSRTPLYLTLHIYDTLIDTHDSNLYDVDGLADEEGSIFAIKLFGLLGNKAFTKKRDHEGIGRIMKI